MVRRFRGGWVALAIAALAIVLFAACGGDDEATPATVTPTATPTPSLTSSPTATATQTPSVEDEVTAAYLAYWDVYADALRRLDGSQLHEVMTGPRLERALSEIESLRTQGQAVRIIVENDPLIAGVSGDEAVIIDEYVNSSYLIDPLTQEPVADRGEPNTLRDTVTLVRENDVWKVRDSVRQASP